MNFERRALEAADDRSIGCIDRHLPYFAIAGQYCQQVDEAVGVVTKPRTHKLPTHPLAQDSPRGRERDRLA